MKGKDNEVSQWEAEGQSGKVGETVSKGENWKGNKRRVYVVLFGSV